MKNIFLLLLFTVSLFPGLKAQQKTYRVEMEQHVVGSTLLLDFYIYKLSGPDFPLGSCNFSLFFNDPTLVDLAGLTLSSNMLGQWDNRTDPARFRAMSIAHRDNYFSLNVNANTSASSHGDLVISTRKPVGRVEVPIANPSGVNTMAWRLAPIQLLDWEGNPIRDLGEFVILNPSKPLCAELSAPVVSVTGESLLCVGQSIELVSSAIGVTHTWFHNGVRVPGSTSNTLVTSVPGTYTVTVTDGDCGSSISNEINIGTILELPTPVVALIDDVLITDAAGDFQWLLNGIPVPGATSSEYVPVESGLYTVEMTGLCGILTSEPVLFNVEPTGRQEADLVSAFSIYPNPFKGQTSIHFSLSAGAEVDLIVYTIEGKRVASLLEQESLSAGHYVHQFSAVEQGYAAGTYSVVLRVNGVSRSVKIVEIL
jgi:hypothetical protein